MAKKNHTVRRKRRVPVLSSVISITLVLFMTGLLGLVIISANELKVFVKENVEFSIYFKDNAREPDIIRMQKRLESEPYIRSATYVSKEEAIQLITQDLGQNPQDLLGFNPLPASLKVYLRSDFAVTDSIAPIIQEFESNPLVREVYYQEALVRNIDQIVNIMAIVLSVLSLVFLVMAITLIGSLVRLTLFSKRFTIKSMQLVGATPGFIRKPFVMKAFFHGLTGSLLAIAMLSAIIYFAIDLRPNMEVLVNVEYIALLFVALTLFGILITMTSSYMALSKYLKMKLDDLY